MEDPEHPEGIHGKNLSQERRGKEKARDAAKGPSKTGAKWNPGN